MARIGIMLIAYATHYLPFGVRATNAALRQLHPELEEAARVAGGSWFRTMRRITLPLVQPAMLAAWVLLFVMAMQEVSSSILLYSSRSIVLSVRCSTCGRTVTPATWRRLASSSSP